MVFAEALEACDLLVAQAEGCAFWPEVFDGSDDIHAFRDLPESEERFDQFTFATHGHLGKSLEPFAVWDFGSSLQPRSKEFKLGDGNFPLVHAKPQMFEQCSGDAVTANPRHLDFRRRIRG